MIQSYDSQTLERVKLTVPAHVICENPDSIFNYFAWPTVNRLPDGRLVLLSSGLRIKHVCPFGKVAVCYSEDEGKNWSAPEVLVNTPLDDRDAGIAVSGNRVCVTTFNNTVAFQRTIAERDAKIMTEEQRKAIFEQLDTVDAEKAEKEYLGSLYLISEDGGKTFGAPKRVPVSAPHGPAVTLDGKFLYVGTLKTNTEEKEDAIQCYLENEKGEFERLSTIADIDAEVDGRAVEPCEPHSIVLPSGRIVVHIRGQHCIAGFGGEGWKDFTLYQSVSDDGGKTFSKPEAVLPVLGGAPPHLYLHSSGALICSYAYRKWYDKADKPDEKSVVCALISYDEGESWKAYHICEADHPWDMGYPATVEKADGTLYTVFYDHVGTEDPAIIKGVEWKLPEA